MKDYVETRNPLIKWQQRILPFAFTLLSGLVLLFIGLYVFQVMKIQDSFLGPDNYKIDYVLKNVDSLNRNYEDKIYHAELLTILNRHHNASLIIKSRILTLNLSFLTGMILCFMGALFVLGKFSETETSIKAGTEKNNLSLISSSPGIILCFLGICLMGISIFSKSSLTIADSPVYLHDISPYNEDIPADILSKELLIDSLKKTTISK